MHWRRTTSLRGSRQLKNRRAALVLVAVEKRGRTSGRARMNVIPDFKASTILRFLSQNVASGFDDLHRRSQELHRSRGGRVQTRRPHPTAPLRVAQRRVLSCPSCGSRHRQSPAVPEWHLPRSEQAATSGLPRRVCLSAQPSKDTRRRISNSLGPWNISQINGLRADSRSQRP